MHRSEKPVGKCHGCALNLRDRCGVYEDPHAMWQKHKTCPGFGNTALFEAWQAEKAAKTEDERKLKRREVAKLRRDEMHHNGDRHVIISSVQR